MRLRSFFVWYHAWLGLLSGVLFAIVGLTGSVLVFYLEIGGLFHPEITARVEAPVPELSRVVAMLRAEFPDRSGPWRIELPRDGRYPLTARYMKPKDRPLNGFSPLIVNIDSATLKITRQYFWGAEPLTWLYDLHYTLLLGESGRFVLGVLVLAWLVFLGVGLWLWWPKRRRLRDALRIDWSSKWPKRIYTWHVVPMVYIFPVLLVLCVTGFVLIMPQWSKPLIGTFSPLTPYFSGASPCDVRLTSPLNADEVVQIALGQFPDAIPRWVETPSPDRGIWRVQLAQPWEPGQRFPRTQVWLDACSGSILAMRNPQKNSSGDTFMDWQHPLHNGEALGLLGRIFVCVAGFLPCLAFLTGVSRWRLRRVAQHKSVARKSRV